MPSKQILIRPIFGVHFNLRPLYWKKAIEVYYAVVIAVAVVAGIVMPNV